MGQEGHKVTWKGELSTGREEPLQRWEEPLKRWEATAMDPVKGAATLCAKLGRTDKQGRGS